MHDAASDTVAAIAGVATLTVQARAVLLDMDGTLVDSSAVVERVWLDWAAAYGLDPHAVLEQIHGRQAYDSMRLLLPDQDPEQALAESHAMGERETTDLDGVRAVPGAAGLLDSLAALPHALVTSATTPLARARMAAAGLRMPHVAVTAEAVSASKPDPEGFLRAATLLDVPPQDCVVLEDSAAGIAAARAAGMRVLGVGAAAARHRPDWAVNDLTGVAVAARGAGVHLTVPTDASADAPGEASRAGEPCAP